MREPTDIDVIADDYVATLCELVPTLATALGVPGHDGDLEDFSPAFNDACAAATRGTLDRLDEATPVDDVDRITVAAMRDRLGLELELHEAREYTADLNVISSPAQGMREIFDLAPANTADDWANLASRMGKIPASMDGYMASLREGLGSGLRPALLQVEEVAKQADELAGAGSFYDEFVAGAPEALVDGALRSDLEKSAAAAREAYGRLAAFLREELAPGAPTADGVGRERYERFSRQWVGAKVDLDETYEWGLAELARVTAEQNEVIERIAGKGATMADAAKALDADPARILNGTDALQAWMQETADAALAALDGVQFDIPEQARTLACRIAPSHSGGIYYTEPNDDFSRPGTMWWAVPEGVTQFSTWNEKSTVYHEGVPGHHLQISTAVANHDLNTWRRQMCFSSGHAEGWALYAERLMDEFGFMTDDGDRLGMLDGQRLRATRVVLDIGVHLGKPAPAQYGGGTWDGEKAWQLLCDNSLMQRDFLRFEFNRYLGWPGQAPSYKIGQRVWEQIRGEVAAKQGDAFSLRDFHDRALKVGSLPLDVLREVLVG